MGGDSVSVLLPYRDAEPTLEAAIHGIATQTFLGWELLLIDNASTDDGPSIAQRWADRDPRIKLLREPRIGVAHALNTGLAYAKGKYIARMDAADVSHPERFTTWHYSSPPQVADHEWWTNPTFEVR